MHIVKSVIRNLKRFLECTDISQTERDFFVNMLPHNLCLFWEMMTACIKRTTEVLKRQYRKSIYIVSTSKESVLSLAWQHTIEIESVIGEYCGKKKDFTKCLYF